jgi:hypothetical protein
MERSVCFPDVVGKQQLAVFGRVVPNGPDTGKVIQRCTLCVAQIPALDAVGFGADDLAKFCGEGLVVLGMGKPRLP